MLRVLEGAGGWRPGHEQGGPLLEMRRRRQIVRASRALAGVSLDLEAGEVTP